MLVCYCRVGEAPSAAPRPRRVRTVSRACVSHHTSTLRKAMPSQISWKFQGIDSPIRSLPAIARVVSNPPLQRRFQIQKRETPTLSVATGCYSANSEVRVAKHRQFPEASTTLGSKVLARARCFTSKEILKNSEQNKGSDGTNNFFASNCRAFPPPKRRSPSRNSQWPTGPKRGFGNSFQPAIDAPRYDLTSCVIAPSAKMVSSRGLPARLILESLPRAFLASRCGTIQRNHISNPTTIPPCNHFFGLPCSESPFSGLRW
jgi:hypothetical protein